MTGREEAESSTKPTDSSLRYWRRFATPWRIVALIILVGAVFRLWGINERHFNEADTSNHWASARMYETTWKWYTSGAYKTESLTQFNDREMGDLSIDQDVQKPFMRLLRAFVMFTAGQRFLMVYSLIDIVFALASMALMLATLNRVVGLRVTVLAGCLWILQGSQYVASGRGYEYSIVIFLSTLTWRIFMLRNQDRLHLRTFLAGLALGGAWISHYQTVVYLPLGFLLVIFFSNKRGILGKLIELVAFASGLAIPCLAVFGFYGILSRLTNHEWVYAPMSWTKAAEADGGTWSQRMNISNFVNDWFVLRFVDGLPFMILVGIGIVVVAILHFKRYGWRWSVCDDPLCVIACVAVYGTLIWGLYYYKCPRSRILEVTTWPVLAALAIHHVTTLVSQRFFRGRGLMIMQAVLIALIMMTQWPHTEPMFKMGGGVRKAMTAISKEGKTGYGEGIFAVWPCTMKIVHPVCHPTLSKWEYMDDYLEENSIDYFWGNYGFVMSFIITYPGAGNILMLETYNRLLSNATPVWHFQYGAPYHALLEYSKIDWVKQFVDWETWRKLHPQPTAYDSLILNIDYFDVYKASDVIKAFRESKIQLMAQLIALQRRNPEEFKRVAGRFWNFLQYNASKPDIMQKASELAARY
jgi:hypothetical protein